MYEAILMYVQGILIFLFYILLIYNDYWWIIYG